MLVHNADARERRARQSLPRDTAEALVVMLFGIADARVSRYGQLLQRDVRESEYWCIVTTGQLCAM
jgi:predicted alpha/beta-fold hydrolase